MIVFNFYSFVASLAFTLSLFLRVQEIAKVIENTNELLLTDKLDGGIVVDALINDNVESPASSRGMSPSSQHAGSDSFHVPILSTGGSPDNGVPVQYNLHY